MVTSHQGACFCGAVQIEVSGNPEAMAAIGEGHGLYILAAFETPMYHRGELHSIIITGVGQR